MFERRCRLLGKRLAGDEGESELDKQKASVSVRRWVDKPSGMHHTHLALDPERDAKLWSAIDAQLASIKQHDGNSGTPIDRLLADAVVAVRVRRADRGMRRVPEICVHVDYQTLLNGLHEHSLCETADGIPLPPETVRRLACEAAIVPIVLNGAGEVLDCGRDVRVANRAQRRALRAMYRTCAYPGCDVALRPLRHPPRHRMAPPRKYRSGQFVATVQPHHHLVHEGRWRLTLDKHRVITIHRPDGTRHFHGTTDRTARRAERSDWPSPASASVQREPNRCCLGTGPP